MEGGFRVPAMVRWPGKVPAGQVQNGMFVYEFWRFVFVNQGVAKYAQTFLDFPPMQKGASFNLEALKAELEKRMEMMKSHASQ